MIGPLRERHLLPMSTPATGLGGIGGVHSDQLTASFFRFARQLLQEGRPRHITDRFRQTMAVKHAVHVQVFHADDPELLDYFPALLMGEVLSAPRDPLMHTSNGLAMCASLWRAFRQLGVRALHFGKSLFFGTKEARILDFLSIREGCKGLESDVNAHSAGLFWQAFWLYLTGERGVPFARAALVDGEGFDFATYRAMVDHFDGANLGEAHPVVLGDAEARLGERETVIAVPTAKTGIAGGFSGLAPSEKRLKGQINAHRHILQHLRMDRFEGKAFVFQARKGFLLLIERKGLALLLPGIAPFFQQVIIQPATLVKRGFQGLHLFFGGIDAILKHFTHGDSITQNRTSVKGLSATPPKPPSKERA